MVLGRGACLGKIPYRALKNGRCMVYLNDNEMKEAVYGCVTIKVNQYVVICNIEVLISTKSM